MGLLSGATHFLDVLASPPLWPGGGVSYAAPGRTILEC